MSRANTTRPRDSSGILDSDLIPGNPQAKPSGTAQTNSDLLDNTHPTFAEFLGDLVVADGLADHRLC